MIKMPTKSTLKRQAKQGKFAYISLFRDVWTHKTAPKLYQITRKTYNMFKLLSSFILYESLQFYKMFAIFERIKQRINERRK
jgi:hypothetical protein